MHSELGEQLRRARETKSLTLEEAEKATGIRKRYLQAMEEGRFDAMPGELQARGFLKSYANYVGLGAEKAMTLYENLGHAAPAAPVSPQPDPPNWAGSRAGAFKPIPPSVKLQGPVQSSRPSPAPQAGPMPQRVAPTTQSAKPASTIETPRGQFELPSWLTLEMVLVAIAVVLVICVAALAVLLFSSGGQPGFSPHPTATRTSRTTLPPPTIPPATDTPAAALSEAALVTNAPGYVQVALAATEHVWVRVTTDGKTAFEGMLAPAQALNWEAKDLLVVETGNGAGLTASVNGKAAGVLGSRGQLVARAWTQAGETAVPPKSATSVPALSPTP